MAIAVNNPAAQFALRRGPGVATLLFAVFAAWVFARIVWLLVPQPDRPPIEAMQLEATQTSSVSGNQRNVDVSTLVNRHLFGKAAVQAKPKAPEKPPQNAPDTKLSLVLSGVILSDIPELSRAFIASGPGKEKAYAIEDEVAKNTKLHAINVDHVILNRNGRFETLRIKKDKAAGGKGKPKGIQRAATPAPSNTQLEGNVAARLTKLRTELMSNPQKASELIRIQPVNNQGKFNGYRVYPGKDRALFREVGLRSGDLITSVNGTQLDDPSKGFALLSEITSAAQITLTIERRGKPQTISVNLGQ